MRLLLLLFAAAAAAQQFEVASVKPAAPWDAPRADVMLKLRDMQQSGMPPGFFPVKGSIATLQNYTLLQLIATAYKVRVDYVVGPQWASDVRFDVEGKMPAGAKNSDAHEMLKALLAERFALKFHRETRTSSGYALVVGKDGVRFGPGVESAGPPSPEEMEQRMKKRMEEMQKPSAGPRPAATWRSASTTVDQVAATLAGWLHAPVINETGLTGKYQVELQLMQPESPDDPVEYRVSQAATRLGLKLESRKTPMEYLVVDSALKTPTEN